jgi:lipoprotein-anchoring transpeptidase ErfK/SrfK
MLKNLVLAVLLASVADFSLAEEYRITVRFDIASLELSRDFGEILKNFPVALPKVRPRLPIEGRVEKTEREPWWAPTAGTREAYFNKFGVELPKIISPNDQRNAMGKGKVKIIFNDKKVDKTIRIHGTNDEKSIGMRVSRGCIRLRNEDILSLISAIEGKFLRVIFVN